MKEYLQTQRFISFLMIFILLPYLSGCYSTKVISKSDLPLADSSKYDYLVHGKKSSFLLEESTIADGILSGKIKQIYSVETYISGNIINVYTSSDSVMKFNTGNIISIPLDGVAKVTLESFDKSDTNGVIFISIVLALVVVGAVSLLVILSHFRPRI